MSRYLPWRHSKDAPVTLPTGKQAVAIPILHEAIEAAERLPGDRRLCARAEIGRFLRLLGIAEQFRNYGAAEADAEEEQVRAAEHIEGTDVAIAQIEQIDAEAKRLLSFGQISASQKVFESANSLREEIFGSNWASRYNDFLGWLLEIRDLGSALEFYRSGDAQRERLQMALLLAHALEKAGRRAEAVELLKEFGPSAEAASDFNTLVVLARAMSNLGEHWKAHDWLRKAAMLSIAAAPNAFLEPTPACIANYQYHSSDREGAIRTLRALLELQPTVVQFVSKAATDLWYQAAGELSQSQPEPNGRTSYVLFPGAIVKWRAPAPGVQPEKTIRIGHTYDGVAQLATSEFRESAARLVELIERKGHWVEAAEVSAYLSNPLTKAHERWEKWGVELVQVLTRVGLDAEASRVMASMPRQRHAMLAAMLEVRAEQRRFDEAFVLLEELQGQAPEEKRQEVLYSGLGAIKREAIKGADIGVFRRAVRRLWEQSKDVRKHRVDSSDISELAYVGQVDGALEFARKSSPDTLCDALLSVVEGITDTSRRGGGVLHLVVRDDPWWY